MSEEISEIKAEVEQTGRRSEFYRQITPDIFMGGVKEGCIEMIAVSARTDAIAYFLSKKQSTELIEEINIKLTPQQAKKLARWLLRHLVLYEKAFGKTKLLDEMSPESIVSNENIPSVETDVNAKVDEILNTLLV